MLSIQQTLDLFNEEGYRVVIKEEQKLTPKQKYISENKEKVNAYHRQYYKKHKEYYSQYYKEHSLAGSQTPIDAQIDEVFEQFGFSVGDVHL